MRINGKPIYLVIVFAMIWGSIEAKKKNPLQPTMARIIHAAGEPSGITYCRSTGTLWLISDSDSYIYETDMEGNLINEWHFTSHKDVEAVTCDDEKQLLYIAEEGRMQITSFTLPRIEETSTYQISKKKLYLNQEDTFHVDLTKFRSSSKSDLPGLEGLTWIPHREIFITALEKKPTLLATLSNNGKLLETQMTDFSKDLSGVAYDSELDLLWVLSDKSERVYLTDISGVEVYDYWDLPVENPEGIVINNDVTPATMYIVTDPSSPKGKQYVPAMFVFTKPEQGSGLRYYNKHDPAPPTVECDGCDAVWKAVKKENHKNDHHGPSVTTIVLASVLPPVVLLLCCILAVMLGICVYRKKSAHYIDFKKLQETNNESDPDKVLTDSKKSSRDSSYIRKFLCSNFANYTFLSNGESSDEEHTDTSFDSERENLWDPSTNV